MFGNSTYPLHEKGEFSYLSISDDNPHAPNLVFVHGMFGGLSNFDPLIKTLDGYNIYVPKIPLYELETDQLSIPAVADWLKDFIEEIGLQHFVLLGNSMGGHVALDYAHRHPEKVQGLVLTGSSGLLEYDFGSSFPKRKSREYLRERANMTFYDDLADDVIVDEILEVVNSRKKLISLLTLTRSTHSHNMEETLPEISQPTLLVWGKQDVVTPPKVARQFQELLPNATLKWINKCGHAPMMERPDQFSAMLKDFLTSLSFENSKSKQL